MSDINQTIGPGASEAAARDWAFEQLHGLLKDVFQALGGGEAFLQQERSAFYGKTIHR